VFQAKRTIKLNTQHLIKPQHFKSLSLSPPHSVKEIRNCFSLA